MGDPAFGNVSHQMPIQDSHKAEKSDKLKERLKQHVKDFGVRANVAIDEYDGAHKTLSLPATREGPLDIASPSPGGKRSNNRSPKGGRDRAAISDSAERIREM